MVTASAVFSVELLAAWRECGRRVRLLLPWEATMMSLLEREPSRGDRTAAGQ